MKESVIEKKLITYCKELNVLCDKFTSPGLKGVPDRIVLAKGFIFFIELKSAKGRISIHQRKDHDRRQKQGFPVEIISTLEELNIFISKLKTLI